MKIALVSRGFSLSFGGAERAAVGVAEALSKAGHGVDVYSDREAEAEVKGVNVIRVKPCILSGLAPAVRLLGFNFAVRKMLAGKNYDVIFGFCQIFPLDVYRAGGGVHAHWMRVRYPGAALRAFKYITSPTHPALLWLEKNMMKPGNYGLVIANSALVGRNMVEYLGTDEKKVRVIYNGVDHAVFNEGLKKHRASVRAELGLPEDSVAALFVGNNWERKGLLTVFKAMAGSEDGPALIVAGRGDIEKFKAVAASMGLGENKVFFAGARKDIERFYGAADFFVLPTQYEPASNACFEAMASGLPVITTASNGASELVSRGVSGYVLDDFDDAVRLADFMKLLMDGARRREFAAAAVLTMKGRTWERTAEETIEVLMEAAAVSKAKRRAV